MHALLSHRRTECFATSGTWLGFLVRDHPRLGDQVADRADQRNHLEREKRCDEAGTDPSPHAPVREGRQTRVKNTSEHNQRDDPKQQHRNAKPNKQDQPRQQFFHGSGGHRYNNKKDVGVSTCRISLSSV